MQRLGFNGLLHTRTRLRRTSSRCSTTTSAVWSRSLRDSRDRARAVACRLCQSCKASSGEVDCVGSSSEAHWSLMTAPSPPASTETYCVAGCFQSSRTYGQPSEIRFSSRITPKSILQNSCCPFSNVTLFRSSPIQPTP